MSESPFVPKAPSAFVGYPVGSLLGGPPPPDGSRLLRGGEEAGIAASNRLAMQQRLRDLGLTAQSVLRGQVLLTTKFDEDEFLADVTLSPVAAPRSTDSTLRELHCSPSDTNAVGKQPLSNQRDNAGIGDVS